MKSYLKLNKTQSYNNNLFTNSFPTKNQDFICNTIITIHRYLQATLNRVEVFGYLIELAMQYN